MPRGRDIILFQKRQELEIMDVPFTLDEGCQVATLYLRLNNISRNSKCICCPFPKCIDELSTNDRIIINHARVLKDLFRMADSGASVTHIRRELNMGRNYILKCLQNRDTIQNILQAWGDILEKQESRNFVISSC